jgi:probable phosphoglycerate mutase
LTRFLLIRHGITDHLGQRISGRMPGVRLSSEGRNSLAGLQKSVSAAGVTQVFSSPLERCRETAEGIAGGKNVTLRDEFQELDFGDWTGLTFSELHDLEAWKRYNRQRSTVKAPGGESAYDVQHRAVAGLLRIREENSSGVFAIVTHADVIRAVVCFMIGAPLDFLLRIQIDPASVTEIEIGEHGMRVLSVNSLPQKHEC